MHIDAMEMAKGGTHAPDKARRAKDALRGLHDLGVTIGTHKLFGPVDVVAEHEGGKVRLVEVEGESSRQRGQALYSCLGQLLLSMKLWGDGFAYGIAVPDSREWVRQLQKIPEEVTKQLRIYQYLIGPGRATILDPGDPVPNWGRG